MLKNKVMLIAGGSSGIGRAIALIGAREGATVVIADINTVEGKKTAAEIKKQGSDAIFFHFDAGSAETGKVTTEVESPFHGVVSDILVREDDVVSVGTVLLTVNVL